jgi:hypothetical protein
VGRTLKSSLGECYGKADRPFELQAGDHLLGHRRDLEGSERLGVLAAEECYSWAYHLVFVVFPRQYLVFSHDHCYSVLCLAQFGEALKLKALKGKSKGNNNKRRKREAVKAAADNAMDVVTQTVWHDVRQFPREG